MQSVTSDTSSTDALVGLPGLILVDRERQMALTEQAATSPPDAAATSASS